MGILRCKKTMKRGQNPVISPSRERGLRRKVMLKKLLIIGAAIMLCTPGRADAAQVSFFIGDVELLRNQKKIPVAVGDTLMTGDVIRTGKDSVMEVRDDNGSTIKILPMSAATIGSKKISGSDTLSLIAGDLSSAFTKLMKGSTKIY